MILTNARHRNVLLRCILWNKRSCGSFHRVVFRFALYHFVASFHSLALIWLLRWSHCICYRHLSLQCGQCSLLLLCHIFRCVVGSILWIMNVGRVSRTHASLNRLPIRCVRVDKSKSGEQCRQFSCSTMNRKLSCFERCMLSHKNGRTLEQC